MEIKKTYIDKLEIKIFLTFTRLNILWLSYVIIIKKFIELVFIRMNKKQEK